MVALIAIAIVTAVQAFGRPSSASLQPVIDALASII